MTDAENILFNDMTRDAKTAKDLDLIEKRLQARLAEFTRLVGWHLDDVQERREELGLLSKESKDG